MNKDSKTYGDPYLETVIRMEPDITPIDPGGAGASIAISLKRIADAMEYFVKEIEKEKQK